MDEKEDPVDLRLRKSLRQLRPLPVRNEEVNDQIDAIVDRYHNLSKSLSSRTEVSESGPLRTLLSAMKTPLRKQILNFKDNGVRGILRPHFFDLQPEAFYTLLPL